MIRILALCGSLRGVSKNRSALRIAQEQAPSGSKVSIWEGLGGLPLFSPDLDQPGLELPSHVSELHRKVDAADGLLIACPEYAHGVPGAFKNALDWLVGSSAFCGKPVALLNVAPHASHAQAQLRETLATMSAEIVESACCTAAFPGADEPGEAFEARVREAMAAYVKVLGERRVEADRQRCDPSFRLGEC